MSVQLPMIDGGTGQRFRIDCFTVPAAARAEFEAAVKRSMAFLETLEGFRGQVVVEKAGGPTAFDIVTIAAWESEEAVEKAGRAARAYYAGIGFNPSAAMAQWRVRAEMGEFRPWNAT